MKKKYIYTLLLFFGSMFTILSVLLYATKDIEEIHIQSSPVAREVLALPLPVTLLIPKINVQADIEHVGVTPQGDMATPQKPFDVGWYKFGTIPGAIGNSVIAGHLDNVSGKPVVFAELSSLSFGDDVYIINQKGERLHFEVIDKKKYKYNATTTLEIFGPTDGVHLNLITCGGLWLSDLQIYEERLVVFAKIKED